MAEARDVHCFSHVFENLKNRTSPSDHVEDIRANVFPAGCPNIPLSVPFCSSFTTTTISLMIRFVHFAEFKVLLNKNKKLMSRELLRKTLDSTGSKLLIASTALRAYRNRHLGTLMRCCEAW